MNPKIGLEIHTYLAFSVLKEKLFCNCQLDGQPKPNILICPTCLGLPGAKPLLPNKEAVEKGIKTALMLNCQINPELVWQRKHYNWPDLPKGYQITLSGSYSLPIGEKGVFSGIRIKETHLEEDPARWNPETGEVDYNRSGYPLIEIVTEPDFDSAEVVAEWLKSLIKVLSYIKAIDRNLGLKADINISLPPDYVRVEIKNINSLSSIVEAINYEAKRQQQLINEGKKVKQETRTWVEEEKTTKFMRSKEEAPDYMFIPEPDLPVIEINPSWLEELKKELPEKPEEKLKKILAKGISLETAKIIANDLELTGLWEKISKKINPVYAADWIRKELLRLLNLEGKDFSETGLKEENLIELLELLEKKEITEETGRRILEELSKKPFSPKKLVKEKGMKIISEVKLLEKLCQEVIKENPQAVKDYQSGKGEALDFLVGQVMKKTKGKAKPQEVKRIFELMIKK